jgi:predicted RNA binding protein YcfA (HicA-like mRNA interferase family)
VRHGGASAGGADGDLLLRVPGAPRPAERLPAVSPRGQRLPRVRAIDVLRALKRAGWYEIRQSGSHVRLRHDERPEDLTIAMHGGDVPTGTLRAIIRQAGLTIAEFQELL